MDDATKRLTLDNTRDQQGPPLIHHEIKDQRAWVREGLSPQDWLVPLPEACLLELHEVVQWLRAHSLPVEDLAPTSFALSACADVMAQVREKLTQGVGLAVIDRVPVERYRLEENKAIFWLLARVLGPIVTQKWDGTRLYDVQDSGQALGYGVRRSITNLGQPLHTDGGWFDQPPEFVGLGCLETALEGGISRFVSLVTVHNSMRCDHPDLLARLYQPFCWDRQAEHGPDDPRSSWHPVFWSDGETLRARYYDEYIRKGYKLADMTLDPEGADALNAMTARVEAPEHWVEFQVEKGQLQYINNYQFAHARTAFRDVPHGGRHMLRLWNRETRNPCAAEDDSVGS